MLAPFHCVHAGAPLTPSTCSMRCWSGKGWATWWRPSRTARRAGRATSGRRCGGAGVAVELVGTAGASAAAGSPRPCRVSLMRLPCASPHPTPLIHPSTHPLCQHLAPPLCSTTSSAAACAACTTCWKGTSTSCRAVRAEKSSCAVHVLGIGERPPPGHAALQPAPRRPRPTCPPHSLSLPCPPPNFRHRPEGVPHGDRDRRGHRRLHAAALHL